MSASQPSQQELDAAHAAMFTAGLTNRRAVAGSTYVDKALATYSSDFSRPMQEYVTESCWHSIWSRPGLERKTRSLLNIAMLCALNRDTELAVHVRGAVNNGASEVEIREVLLQAACYCGMPAGIAGFRVAERVLEDMKAERAQGKSKATETEAPPEVRAAADTTEEPQVEGGQSLNPS